MKEIFICICLIFSSYFLVAQTRNSKLIIEFSSGYTLSELLKGEKLYQGCSSWKLRKVILLDSLKNKLGEQQFWSKGMDYKWDATVEFKEVKPQKWYLIEISENGKQNFDTLRIKNMVNHKMGFEFNQVETAKVLKQKTFIDELQNGDSLNISFSEYGCEFANSEILILKYQDQFSIQLIEKLSKIEKIFRKDNLSEIDLKLIRAFEYDSFREYRKDECSDMGYNYTLKLKEKTRAVQDSCGDWGGYYYLKQGIFRD